MPTATTIHHPVTHPTVTHSTVGPTPAADDVQVPTGVSRHLKADGLDRSYGDRRVLSGVSLVVPPGRRLGLIGENGAGKSTLLRLLAGAERADAGTITRPARTGILWQEVRFDATDRVDDVIERELAAVRAIERELDEASTELSSARADGADAAADRYAAALDAAETAEVWTISARRDALLEGLGVGHIERSRSLGSVSGGERSRIALAALLLARPEALLLDEPTNHLDDAAVAFLAAELRGWRGPVVFASHDRAFLDSVADALLDLDPALAGATSASARGLPGDDDAPSSGATVFSGRYSDYLVAKAAERARWEERYAADQEELAELRESVAHTSRNINHARTITDRNKMAYDFRANRVQTQIGRRVRNAKARLEELLETQTRKPPAPLDFAGLPTGFAPAADAGVALQLNAVRVDGRLEVDAFVVPAEARILVTGHNGAGKSTLLSVLAGRLRPDSGVVQRRKGVRIGLLEQDVRFAEPELSPRRVYESVLGERRAEAIPLTSLGLLAPRDLDRAIGSLSIGQQRRVALALIIAKPPHVFLLDEPTNHLSLGLATELEDALGTYPGAVVIASHDRWLRERWEGDEVRMRAGRLA